MIYNIYVKTDHFKVNFNDKDFCKIADMKMEELDCCQPVI